tara:strand:+ start:89 stop:775 length:687 start_codon:yes stop_codon:yes gene_type:complete
MQFRQRMFNRYGFSYFKKRLTPSEKLDLITIISNIEKNKHNNIVYKKTFNVYDDIMTASIENIKNKNLYKLINNYSIINIARYLRGMNTEIHDIKLVYNNPLTINNYINRNKEEKKNDDIITCIINLSDYKLAERYDLFYQMHNFNKFNVKDYHRLTSQEKLNPLNGCLKIYPEVKESNESIDCPTSFGDIIFINSSIKCKYNMNHGIEPMKSVHIEFKNETMENKTN